MLALALCLAVPVCAAEKKVSKEELAVAVKLAKAMGYPLQMQKTAGGITTMLVNGSKNFHLGLSDQEREKFAAALTACLMDSLSAEFAEGVAKWLAQELPLADLKELLTLFSTPAGKKAAKVMPMLNIYAEQYSRALVVGRYNDPSTSRAIFGQALGKLDPKLKDKINRLRKKPDSAK